MTDEKKGSLRRILAVGVKIALSLSLGAVIFMESGDRALAQEGQGHIHVVVNLVQLNVAVTDKNGNYITGLTPKDFLITEDGIPQKPATFGEGNGPTRSLLAGATDMKPEPAAADVVEQASARSSLVDRQTLHNIREEKWSSSSRMVLTIPASCLPRTSPNWPNQLASRSI